MEYFIFNKALDYERGCRINLTWNDNGFGIQDIKSQQPGIFISRVLDSREAETRWHRMIVDCRSGDNMAVFFRIYATDREEEAEEVRQLLREEGTLPEKMQNCLKPYLQTEYRDPKDVLLTSVSRRFLWIMVVLYGNGVDGPWISGMQIYFQAKSWSGYLPEVYRNQDFLERFLAVFQSLYDDMDQKIRQSASCLDINTTAEPMLLELSGWLAMEESSLWNMERLRRYLENGVSVYRSRGTRKGLADLITVFTGEEPHMLEPSEEEGCPHLTIWVGERAVRDLKDYKMLFRLIRKQVPAWIPVRLIIWKPYLVLGQDTCLGINSIIRPWEDAGLDGMSMMNRVRMGGDAE